MTWLWMYDFIKFSLRRTRVTLKKNYYIVFLIYLQLIIIFIFSKLIFFLAFVKMIYSYKLIFNLVCTLHMFTKAGE